jgi:predicted RNA-binding protein
VCESNVYIKKGDKEELIMANVAAITPVENDRYVLRGLLGDRCEITGKIVDINLMAHKIVFI